MSEFSAEQLVTLGRFERWLNDPSTPQIFSIFGHAGTGKTTVARQLKIVAAQYGHHVHYAAFTNKAVFVLRKKGCNPASTIHTLIYTPDTPPGLHPGAHDEWELIDVFGKITKSEHKNLNKPGFARKPPNLKPGAIIILDEVSMISREMFNHLRRLPHRIVAIGDPFQLPPINEASSPFIARTPDSRLTQILRTDRPGLIEAAAQIRDQKNPRYGRWNGAAIHTVWNCSPLEKRNYLLPLIPAADQIICGLNITRVELNYIARQINGYAARDPEGMPVPGDKLICYRTDIVPLAADPKKSTVIVNGSLWSVEEAQKAQTKADKIPFMLLTLKSLDDPDIPDITARVPLPYFDLGDGHTHPDTETTNAIDRAALNPAPVAIHSHGFQAFTYGYAITCHKAQGSEWPNTLVIDQAYCFQDTRWQWLYTAITRAQNHATLIRYFW